MKNECIEQVWEQYRPFVYKIALKYVGLAELEDLLQEGFIGLYKAVNHYDSNNGALFMSYAAYWIKQTMQRYIDDCCSCIRIPVKTAENVRIYKKTASEYEKRFGRKPSDAEIMDLMGISGQVLANIQQAAKMGQIESMTAPFGEDGGTYEEITGNDGIEDEIIGRLDLEEMKRDVHAAVDRLPDRERSVINRRFF